MTMLSDLVLDFLQAGDEAHRKQLKALIWAECEERVERLARRYTRQCPHRREDFKNEAYLKFESVLPTFDPARNVPFAAYLVRCVKRRFLDLRNKKGEGQVDMARAERQPGREADPVDQLAAAEIATRIRQTLRSLLPGQPSRERKIKAFELRKLDGWDVTKIARFFGVERPNTVSVWICEVGRAFEAEFSRRYPEYFEQ